MNKILLMIFSLTLFLLYGCSSNRLSFDRMLTTAEKPSFTEFYLKKETKTYYNGKLKNTQLFETWEDVSTGSALHKLQDSEEGTFYTIITKKMMTQYKKGNDYATVKRVPSLYFSNIVTQKEDTLETLEALRITHTLKLVDEQTISGEQTYYFEALPRERNQLLGKQQLWINQKNWMIMQKQVTIDQKIIEEKVLQFEDTLSNRNVQFTLPTQEEKSIKFIYESIPQEKITNSISAPIYHLEPSHSIELLQIKEILTPSRGYRLVYTKNREDFLQLKATEKQKNAAVHIAEPDLRIGNQFVSIQLIPNVGIELVFSDIQFDYEILYMDPFATKDELQNLLDSLQKDQ